MATTSEPAARLAPAAPARPRVRRALRALRWIAVIALPALTCLVGPPRPSCRAATQHAPATAAAAICEREYVRSADPAIGALLADAHRRAGRPAVAAAIARGLLATSAYADARRVLAAIDAAAPSSGIARPGAAP